LVWFFGLGPDFLLGCGWIRVRKAALVFFWLAKGFLCYGLLGVFWLRRGFWFCSCFVFVYVVFVGLCVCVVQFVFGLVWVEDIVFLVVFRVWLCCFLGGCVVWVCFVYVCVMCEGLYRVLVYCV